MTCECSLYLSMTEIRLTASGAFTIASNLMTAGLLATFPRCKVDLGRSEAKPSRWCALSLFTRAIFATILSNFLELPFMVSEFIAPICSKFWWVHLGSYIRRASVAVIAVLDNWRSAILALEREGDSEALLSLSILFVMTLRIRLFSFRFSLRPDGCLVKSVSTWEPRSSDVRVPLATITISSSSAPPWFRPKLASCTCWYYYSSNAKAWGWGSIKLLAALNR